MKNLATIKVLNNNFTVRTCGLIMITFLLMGTLASFGSKESLSIYAKNNNPLSSQPTKVTLQESNSLAEGTKGEIQVSTGLNGKTNMYSLIIGVMAAAIVVLVFFVVLRERKSYYPQVKYSNPFSLPF